MYFISVIYFKLCPPPKKKTPTKQQQQTNQQNTNKPQNKKTKENKKKKGDTQWRRIHMFTWNLGYFICLVVIFSANAANQLTIETRAVAPPPLPSSLPSPVSNFMWLEYTINFSYLPCSTATKWASFSLVRFLRRSPARLKSAMQVFRHIDSIAW